MTYHAINRRTFGELLLPHFPNEPQEIYEQALHAKDLADTLAELAAEFREKSRQLIEKIRAEAIPHNEYQLLIRQTPIRKIRIETLREHFPDLVAELAYIPAAAARKILGDTCLTRLARQAAPARARELEQIRLQDLDQRLTPEEAREFIEIIRIDSQEPEIILKSGSDTP